MKKHKFNIFPPATGDDYGLLLADIKANGYDKSFPITLYCGDILDGWNRWNACQETGDTPSTVEFCGTDTEALEFTMRSNKRRNLTSSQWAAIAAEAEEFVESISVAVEEERRRKQAETQSGAVGQLIVRQDTGEHDNKTAHKTAEAFNTNRTYVNIARKLKAENPEEFERVKSGECSIPQIKKAHVSNNSGENEWYTPVEFISSAVETMGDISLDPASSDMANKTVCASKFYTKEDDGLNKEWRGNIWMNPPYAQPLIKQFSDKLCETIGAGKITAACVLVNNATETAWFQQMASIADGICLIARRVKFLDVTGKPGAPLQGQIVLYFGVEYKLFNDSFSKHGEVFRGANAGV